jgi:hypothetical protein
MRAALRLWPASTHEREAHDAKMTGATAIIFELKVPNDPRRRNT